MAGFSKGIFSKSRGIWKDFLKMALKLRPEAEVGFDQVYRIVFQAGMMEHMQRP